MAVFIDAFSYGKVWKSVSRPLAETSTLLLSRSKAWGPPILEPRGRVVRWRGEGDWRYAKRTHLGWGEEDCSWSSSTRGGAVEV
jgi:hypothetical protein